MTLAIAPPIFISISSRASVTTPVAVPAPVVRASIATIPAATTTEVGAACHSIAPRISFPVVSLPVAVSFPSTVRTPAIIRVASIVPPTAIFCLVPVAPIVAMRLRWSRLLTTIG